MQPEDCIHPFGNGFVPETSKDRTGIIVTRSSPLISFSRTPAGEYRIWGGSFICGDGCREGTAEGDEPPFSERPQERPSAHSLKDLFYARPGAARWTPSISRITSAKGEPRKLDIA
jgi:hypothetical protein